MAPHEDAGVAGLRRRQYAAGERIQDGIEPLSAQETDRLKKEAEKTDLKIAAENVGVARFISDDPFTMLKMSQYGISFNLDGIWGGNMYAGGGGAILPKHGHLEAQHPIAIGGAGRGGNAHAANEYFVIEGAGKATAWPVRKRPPRRSSTISQVRT